MGIIIFLVVLIILGALFGGESIGDTIRTGCLVIVILIIIFFIFIFVSK